MTKKLFIKDCIYRFIEVDPICQQFMDTPEFQRLRHIKQLGMVHYVYPSAVHTRFEHSLGVMHLAGRMIDSLKRNGYEITARDKQLCQLTGLLHDIGHIAYSHLLDEFLKTSGKPGHEERSVSLLININNRLKILSQEEEDMVCNMIRGIQPHNNCIKPFLYQIVCNESCGIDVDRLDYLQRDAYHTGMSGFQPDYLIECARIGENGDLCFLNKARKEIKSMYNARAHMFETVYRHKTVIKIEKTIISLIPHFDDFINFIYQTWLKIDDVALVTFLRKIPGYDRIHYRNWTPFDDENCLQHCKLINSDEIDTEIAKVTFI